jgi:hypothetical protein
MTQSGTGQSSAVRLDAPRFVTGKAMVITGLKEQFTSETMNNIPQLWQRFVPYIGHIPGKVGRLAYGLFANMTANPFEFDYMAGRGYQHVWAARGIQPRERSGAALRGVCAPRAGVEDSRDDRCGAQVVPDVGAERLTTRARSSCDAGALWRRI